MFSQPEVPVQVNVQVDNQYLDKHLKEYVEQYCKTFLQPEWYTMSDMEKSLDTNGRGLCKTLLMIRM